MLTPPLSPSLPPPIVPSWEDQDYSKKWRKLGQGSMFTHKEWKEIQHCGPVHHSAISITYSLIFVFSSHFKSNRQSPVKDADTFHKTVSSHCDCCCSSQPVGQICPTHSPSNENVSSIAHTRKR